ncbi:hypothetical protein [Bradyrhizobium canariense]|uniref:hypothetical protein n=1 Tax=Bradyrhizobium canariense TaxID=255045 RepID=UPI001CA54779|nr:hypothetical protein [Bradyrhizobium canariense]
MIGMSLQNAHHISIEERILRIAETLIAEEMQRRELESLHFTLGSAIQRFAMMRCKS